jgi:hypothetical protein
MANLLERLCCRCSFIACQLCLRYPRVRLSKLGFGPFDNTRRRRNGPTYDLNRSVHSCCAITTGTCPLQGSEQTWSRDTTYSAMLCGDNTIFWLFGVLVPVDCIRHHNLIYPNHELEAPPEASETDAEVEQALMDAQLNEVRPG